MDSKSLDFGNVSVLSDPVLSQCRHGKRWDMCKMARCREIWQLLQQQWEEQRRDEKDRQNAKIIEKRRGKKSEYQIAMEQKEKERLVASDYEYLAAVNADELPNAIPRGARKLLRDIFPDEITLRAAIQFKAVTLRQGQVLKEYLDSDEELPNYKRWDWIGKKIGFSGKTVGREFQVLVAKFLKTRDTMGEREAAIEVVQVRGERQPRYYRRHSLQFGEWKREWTELISDWKTIRELRKDGTPTVKLKKTPVPASSVNRLFAALIEQFALNLPKHEHLRPQDVSASEWQFNLRRAQRLLEGKNHLTGPWTALEITKKLARDCRLCGACRTFLIRGFRVGGRQITRAREFCDDACRMRAERRKRTKNGSKN